MKRKIVSGMMLAPLLIGMFTIAFGVQPVKADWTWTETIYIRADGSVEPDTAPISTVDNITYTLTDNIVGNVPEWSSAIVVERDNIVVDGGNYTVQGTGSGTGLSLTERSNITTKNMEITGFDDGIWLNESSNNILYGNNITGNSDNGIYISLLSNNNTISGNNVTNNSNDGINLLSSSNTTISGNNVTNNEDGIVINFSPNYNIILGNTVANNTDDGIVLYSSSNNTIYGNNIIRNRDVSIYLYLSSNYNTISGNNIANSYYGIVLYSSSNNIIYHNNFVNNTYQVYNENSVNDWDDGYPSGGNYWDDYIDVDLFSGPDQDIPGSDGIWDHSYTIDANNTDNYPLVNPYVPGNLTVSISTDKYTYNVGDTMILGLSVTNPDSVKYLDFAIWVELPDNSIYVYMHEHSILLQIGLNYANPAFESITLPSIPIGTYTWHGAFLEKGTHTIITEDIAEWEFN